MPNKSIPVSSNSGEQVQIKPAVTPSDAIKGKIVPPPPVAPQASGGKK